MSVCKIFQEVLGGWVTFFETPCRQVGYEKSSEHANYSPPQRNRTPHWAMEFWQSFGLRINQKDVAYLNKRSK